MRVITGIHGRGPLVRTIVGQGLFGIRRSRRPRQRPSGSSIAWDWPTAGGHLYIADTYNNKVKICDPKNRSVKTLVGSPQAGRQR